MYKFIKYSLLILFISVVFIPVSIAFGSLIATIMLLVGIAYLMEDK